MIQVTVFRNRNEKYIGFDCKGHAGYANYGEDVICAGVSALVINTVNAISRYAGGVFRGYRRRNRKGVFTVFTSGRARCRASCKFSGFRASGDTGCVWSRIYYAKL